MQISPRQFLVPTIFILLTLAIFGLPFEYCMDGYGYGLPFPWAHPGHNGPGEIMLFSGGENDFILDSANLTYSIAIWLAMLIFAVFIHIRINKKRIHLPFIELPMVQQLDPGVPESKIHKGQQPVPFSIKGMLIYLSPSFIYVLIFLITHITRQHKIEILDLFDLDSVLLISIPIAIIFYLFSLRVTKINSELLFWTFATLGGFLWFFLLSISLTLSMIICRIAQQGQSTSTLKPFVLPIINAVYLQTLIFALLFIPIHFLFSAYSRRKTSINIISA